MGAVRPPPPGTDASTGPDPFAAPPEPTWLTVLRTRESRHAQGTPGWIEERRKMYTASEVGAVLNEPSAWSGESDVWVRKLGSHYEPAHALAGPGLRKRKREDDGFSAYNMLIGSFYEHRAMALYAVQENVNVYHTSLIHHAELDWLGGSPDGITEDGRLVEVKTAVRRIVNPLSYPDYYYAQIQTNLECMDLEWCDLVEYQAPWSPDADEESAPVIHRVRRDRRWWTLNRPRLIESYGRLREMFDGMDAAQTQVAALEARQGRFEPVAPPPRVGQWRPPMMAMGSLPRWTAPSPLPPLVDDPDPDPGPGPGPGGARNGRT